MPEITIRVGGRPYLVACQSGEEAYLEAAAGLLDTEASALTKQIGILPENRVLLMAGLMLADKAGANDDQGEVYTSTVQSLQSRIEVLEAELAEANARPVETVEVSTIPPEVANGMQALSARAEALADRLDGKVTSDASDA